MPVLDCSQLEMTLSFYCFLLYCYLLKRHNCHHCFSLRGLHKLQWATQREPPRSHRSYGGDAQWTEQIHCRVWKSFTPPRKLRETSALLKTREAIYPCHKPTAEGAFAVTASKRLSEYSLFLDFSAVAIETECARLRRNACSFKTNINALMASGIDFGWLKSQGCRQLYSKDWSSFYRSNKSNYIKLKTV